MPAVGPHMFLCSFAALMLSVAAVFGILSCCCHCAKPRFGPKGAQRGGAGFGQRTLVPGGVGPDHVIVVVYRTFVDEI